MNIKKHSLLSFLILILTIQMACNAPAAAPTPDTFATLNGLYTASALTQTGLPPSGLTATPGLPQPTATLGSGVPAVPTSTFIVSSPVPAPRCDAAEFISDVTYPDGSIVTRSNTFVKVWRIRNIGTCTWTPSYKLVFTSGDLMNGPYEVALTQNINPGNTVDLQVTFTAPGTDGNYLGYWKLKNSSGGLFGIGGQADVPFWVNVRVTGPSFVAYDFIANYCNASWENNSAALPCPGNNGDANGYVIRLNSPVMENGTTEDEPGLLTTPQDIRNGIITGQYPSFTVQAGDRFRTIINCQYNSKKCDVVFKLDYKSNGTVKTLGNWNEVYEGQYYPIDLDLSSLAGQTVKFILTVNSNGGQNGDDAIWLNPHIIRQGVPPSPTPTFTPTFTPSPTPTLTFTPTPAFTVSSVNFVNSGICGNFTATANITTNGAGTATYHWVWSDGSVDAAVHPPLVFAAAGTQSVSTTWTTTAPGTNWIDIYIDTPNNKQFGRASFTCP